MGLDREILATSRALVERGLVVGTAGNVSARARGGIRITPSRMDYRRLRRRDLVTVDPAGTAVGRRTPSLELPMHLAVYAARPDVQAIVHAHSPHATAWSYLDAPLGPPTEDMTYLDIGPVRTSAPAPAGSSRLAERAVRALGDSAAALLGRHGVLAVGASVQDALAVAEAVEHQAQVAWLLRGHTPRPPAPRPMRRRFDHGWR
jgi:ribulose-5-phosphate 4-epimerase/fuculose-1-phosphate aldolase